MIFGKDTCSKANKPERLQFDQVPAKTQTTAYAELGPVNRMRTVLAALLGDRFGPALGHLI